ncbi:MAG: hypothetical protein KDA51_06640 [Planctomycetales bacterium]|nr:hypothetical protein [Planctomycetales bacterium]
MAELHSTDVQPYLNDIGCYLTTCTNAFRQIGAVLRQAEKLTNEHTDLQRLISAAEYLAADVGYAAERWRGEVESKEYRTAAPVPPSRS